MSEIPHGLAAEFPDKVEAIEALKQRDPHFARLVADYDAVNGQVHRAETYVEPTDQFHEEDLRKQRVHLKDEIWRILAEQAA